MIRRRRDDLLGALLLAFFAACMILGAVAVAPRYDESTPHGSRIGGAILIEGRP